MENTIFTRKELYDLVWSAPMPRIIEKIGVTDYQMRKICQGMNIPIPYPGYWTSIRYGVYKPVKTVLPDDYEGPQQVDLTLKYDLKMEKVIVPSPIAILQKEIENDTRLNLAVHESLTLPDPLIIRAETDLTRKTPWLIHGCLIGCDSSNLDIRVSPPLVTRALKFMDAFVKALQIRGNSIGHKEKYTCAAVLDEKIEIKLREKLKMAPRKDRWSSVIYEPTGLLSFQITFWGYTEHVWNDGKRLLEDQLSSILARIEYIGQQEHLNTLERKREKEEEQERLRIQKELKERQEKELNDFRELLATAKRWRETELLRNYLEAVQQRAFHENTRSEDLNDWIQWAQKKVDWYDPFVEAEDELLGEVERNDLSGCAC